MKILSVLLLLALGTAAAWWKVTWPNEAVADVPARLAVAADTLRREALALRDTALAAARTASDGATSDDADTSDARP